jgi:hypothetical protein
MAVGGEINLQLHPEADTSSQDGAAAAVDKMRQLPREFEELTEDMGAFAALTKDCGLGQEYMEYVMQHRAGGVATVEGDDLDADRRQPEPE